MVIAAMLRPVGLPTMSSPRPALPGAPLAAQRLARRELPTGQGQRRSPTQVRALFGGGRREAKVALLESIEGTNRGAGASAAQAEAVDAAAAALTALNPTRKPTAGKLQGVWSLAYTTEKDVHFLAVLPVQEISQEVDLEGAMVTNRVVYKLPISLVAKAPLEVVGPARIEYEFSSFVLTVLGAELSITPRGKGWSESVYVDDELRVVRNSRGDLLVLERA